jgi:glucose dehydrogenase
VIKSGAVRIFLYNWPIYVGTWTLSVVAMLVGLRIGGLIGGLVAAGGSAATLWSLLSLGVSHYVYDRSALASGAWVPSLLAGEPATWATIDAGLDAGLRRHRRALVHADVGNRSVCQCISSSVEGWCRRRRKAPTGCDGAECRH